MSYYPTEQDLLRRAVSLYMHIAQGRDIKKTDYKLVKTPLRIGEVGLSRRLAESGKVILRTRCRNGKNYVHTYSLTETGVVEAVGQLALENAHIHERLCLERFMGNDFPPW
jgi:hypothetical protein